MIEIPEELLPTELEEKISFCNNYFSGKKVTLEKKQEKLYANLDWYKEPEFYIDTEIEDNIRILDENLSIKSIPYAKVQRNGFNLMLNDNWTLHFWSKWLKEKIDSKIPLNKVIIIHIDDHYDCMPPLLFRQADNSLKDAITGKNVCMNVPDTIESAILSGAIAIGSFMPVILHDLESTEFRYLLPEHRNLGKDIKGEIYREHIADKLFTDSYRPSLSFRKEIKGHQPTYLLTKNIRELLADIEPNASILLHIDMDYFNNRFDGDSDWLFNEKKHNPSSQEVLKNIEEVFYLIRTELNQAQIENITIALSPGFFPSEFWKESLNIIEEHLGQ